MPEDRETYLAIYASMLERSELYLERELEAFSEQSEFIQYASRLLDDPAKLVEAIAADPRFSAVLAHVLRLPLNMITLRRHRKILQEQRNVEF